MSAERYYITTPIYYVNDVPHIGHAYTSIAVDMEARFQRMLGRNVKFLTGTDEHGQKVAEAAAAKGEDPQSYVDRLSVAFRDLLPVIEVSNDDFIRTTQDRHVRVVEKLFARLMEKGYVYKSKYKGMYCKPCETFFPSNQIGDDGCCPDCGRKLVEMEEESYFLRTSDFAQQLLTYYEEHPDAIKPVSRYNEVVSFLRGGLKDQCVSRASVPWAITVPGDEQQTIYVWIDALLNYLSALGEDETERKLWWSQARHVVGKDIIRFHCVIWPIMLMMLGLEPAQTVVAHGWWTVEGEKMSKSKGNAVDPHEMVKLYGADAFRYFLLRQMPFGLDGDFSEEALVKKFNSDLANDLGNLLSRTVSMAEKYQDGTISAASSDQPLDQELKSLCEQTWESYRQKIEDFNFDGALKDLWALIGRANKYIDETMPWKLASDPQRLNAVLFHLAEVLGFCTSALLSVLPKAAPMMARQLGDDSLVESGAYANWRWGRQQGWKVCKGDLLFPRIDLKVWAQEKARRDEAKKQPQSSEQSKEKKGKHHDDGPLPQISIDQFAACELRVGEITEVVDVPKADRLYKLTVDLGKEQRTVVSSIKACFTPEQLLGQQVILLCNLKPAKMRGVESNGMILAGSYEEENGEVLGLLQPHCKLPLGTRIF